MALKDVGARLVVEGLPQFKAGMAGADKAMGSFAAKIERTSESLGKMGRNLTMKVTAPLVAIGIASFKMAGDFDLAFRKVNVMLRASADEAQKYKKEILNVSRVTGKNAIEVADAFYQIVSAGHRGADAIDILRVAMKGATGGAADAITTTEALTKAMNIFGLVGVAGASRAMDVFFGIVDTGLLTFEEMALAFPMAATMAAGLGVTIEETGAALGTLTKVSGSTRQASTALNAVFTMLIKPSADLLALYKEWGVATGPEAIEKFGGLKGVLDKVTEATGGNVDTMAALFPNVEAIRAILPLVTTNADDFADALDVVKKSTGRTGEAFDEMTEGPGFQWQKMLVDLKNSSIELGDAIAGTLGPMMEEFMEKVKALITWFVELSPAMRNAATKAVMLVAGLGPFLIILGQIAKGIGVLIVVFKAAIIKTVALNLVLLPLFATLKAGLLPLLGIIAGITMLIFGISQLIKNSRIREVQAKREEDLERININLKKEHARAMEGLDNKYLLWLREADHMDFALTEEQRAYLELNKEIEIHSRLFDKLTEARGMAQAGLNVFAGFLDKVTGVREEETKAVMSQYEALRAENRELLEQYRLKLNLADIAEAYRTGVITWETFAKLEAQSRTAVREATNLQVGLPASAGAPIVYNTNYNVEANYTNPQDPASIALDIEALTLAAGR